MSSALHVAHLFDDSPPHSPPGQYYLAIKTVQNTLFFHLLCDFTSSYHYPSNIIAYKDCPSLGYDTATISLLRLLVKHLALSGQVITSFNKVI